LDKKVEKGFASRESELRNNDPVAFIAGGRPEGRPWGNAPATRRVLISNNLHSTAICGLG